MRFVYILSVAAFLAVAYATSETEVKAEELSKIPHVREKRTLLLKKKLALVGGAALLAKGLIGAKVVGAGLLGAKALGAGLIGAKLIGGGFGGGQ